MRLKLLCVLAILLLAGCEESEATKARNAALDSDDSRVKDCDFNTMGDIAGGIRITSWGDFSQVCQHFFRSQGTFPPIRVLRKLALASSMLKVDGLQQEPRDIGYQLVAIIEARGVTDSEQMIGTIEIVWKAHHATGGRVTPKELNVALRAEGLRARAMSDDALYMLTAVLWNIKKDRGE